MNFIKYYASWKTYKIIRQYILNGKYKHFLHLKNIRVLVSKGN